MVIILMYFILVLVDKRKKFFFTSCIMISFSWNVAQECCGYWLLLHSISYHDFFFPPVMLYGFIYLLLPCIPSYSKHIDLLKKIIHTLDVPWDWLVSTDSASTWLSFLVNCACAFAHIIFQFATIRRIPFHTKWLIIKATSRWMCPLGIWIILKEYELYLQILGFLFPSRCFIAENLQSPLLCSCERIWICHPLSLKQLVFNWLEMVRFSC